MSRSRRHSRPSLGSRLMALLLVVLAVVFILPKIKQRLNYPVRYAEEIRAACAVYDLPPALISAIAVTESSFNPSAQSSAGARGLMQITPSTGEWIASQLREDQTYNHDQLFDPLTSLRYACWYMDFLLRRFDGDEVCAIASYHAGQGSVSKWLKDPAYSSDGHTLAAFPNDAPQTKHYVAKVQKAYEYYKKFY